MGSRDFYDIFNECVDRMAAGQSLEACLRLYPAEASRLRPLLEAGAQVRHMLPEAVEMRADQSSVWQHLEPQLARQRLNRRRNPGIGRLLLAAALLTGLLGGAYFALSRPQQDTNLIEPLVTTSPTHTDTATPTSTFTPTLTPTPSATPSDTPSPTPTDTSSPVPTALPTATPFPMAPQMTVPPPGWIDNGDSDSANDDDGDDDSRDSENGDDDNDD